MLRDTTGNFDMNEAQEVMDSMTDEQAMESIELSERVAKEKIKAANCLQRLANNPDWKYLIDEVYFKEEPARLTLLLTSPAMQLGDAKRLELCQKDLEAIGLFYAFLMNVAEQGTNAKAALESYNEERQNILREVGSDDAVEEEGDDGID